MTSNNSLMILIILLSLLIAAAVIIALVRRKKRKSKANRKNTTLYTSTKWETQKIKSENNVLGWKTNENTALGWKMIAGAWLLIAGLLYMFFDNWLEHQNNPNQHVSLYSTAEKNELILKRNRSGHYITPGAINGKPVTFMLDTGATLVSVPAHLGPTLGLSPGAYGKSQTANGTVDIRFTKISSLIIGPFQITEVRGALNPGMNDDQILLGMSVLKQLEFTQSGKNLILRQPSK